MHAAASGAVAKRSDQPLACIAERVGAIPGHHAPSRSLLVCICVFGPWAALLGLICHACASCEAGLEGGDAGLCVVECVLLLFSGCGGGSMMELYGTRVTVCVCCSAGECMAQA